MKFANVAIAVIICLLSGFSVLFGNSSFVSHGYQSTSVTVWASSGTLSTGALYKMVEVAVDEPNMLGQGFQANNIEQLRTEVASIFAAEKLRVEQDYRTKVFAYTTDALLRAELLSQNQFDVTQNDANTHTFLRFFRIVFGSKLAFQIYSAFAEAETMIEEGFFTTKVSVINPVIMWGICQTDDFVVELIHRIKTYFPTNTLPNNQPISVGLVFQWQTFLRREHSNADTVEMQMSGLYLHEWQDSENRTFVVYTVTANAALWYIIALGATALFLAIGLYLAQAVKQQTLKNRDIGELSKETAQPASQSEQTKADGEGHPSSPPPPKVPPQKPTNTASTAPNQPPSNTP